MSELFSSLSGLTMIVAVSIYFVRVVGGTVTPNPTTWMIWLVVMTMNTVTYYFVSQGNFLQIITPLAVACGTLLVVLFSFLKGKFGKIGKIDVIVLCLSCAVGIFWKTTGDPVVSNLMMQIILLISFIPTVVGLIKGRLREKCLVWNLGVLSYCFLMVSILLSPSWTWTQLVYPFLNGVVGNGSVAVVVFLTKKGDSL
jgi:hypothetical protein